ncbi:MAG: class I SAM-dependent methyltransferase [Acidobacteriota bacterium]
MDILSHVSETALITLKARVLEARKRNPLIRDEMGIELLGKLEKHQPEETRKRILDRKIPGSVVNHISLRSRKYDFYTEEFLQNNPEGLVVSLGCGFDTRFWRLSADPARYIEIDLAPVVEAKKELLGSMVTYRMIGASVLANEWLDEILKIQDKKILFLAEGLLMYLKRPDVLNIFSRISSAVSESGIVFEVVNERYTRGFWKKMLISKMKRSLGSAAGASFDFGVRDSTEIESFGKSIRVIEEWSYFEDESIKPAILKLFRNWKFMSRTQWTVKASIGRQSKEAVPVKA